MKWKLGLYRGYIGDIVFCNQATKPPTSGALQHSAHSIGVYEALRGSCVRVARDGSAKGIHWLSWFGTIERLMHDVRDWSPAVASRALQSTRRSERHLHIIILS